MPADRTTAPAATKPWWHSRTLWFNLVCALLAAAEAGLGMLQAVLPVNAYAVLAFGLAVGNAGLRVVTSARLIGRTPPAGGA
jgi:hypothetical protein